MGNIIRCCCSNSYKRPIIISNNILYQMSETDYLANVKYEDTVSFVFPIKYGKVIKVYDGDTFTIAAKLPNTTGPMYRFSVRLNGIDTPEIKCKTDDEKIAAKQAKNALANLILNKYVTLKNIQTEKYGRILADVYVGELHVNMWLITEKYAVKYDGGTKKSPESWLNYRNNL